MSLRRFFALLLGTLGLLWPAPGRAQGLGATAAISSRNGTVGTPLQFELRCAGTNRVGQPPPIQVEGLDIRYLGPSTQMQIINGATSSSVTHIYQVVPLRVGNFTIPAIEVELDGRRFRTAPLPLTVTPGQPAAAPTADLPMDKIGFAEVTVSKTTAYVGEALVAEVRLLVDARVQSQIETLPQFEGDGFTKTKLGEPRRETTQRDGREYNVVAFRTAITPHKAGKIAIGPAEFSFIAQIPRAQRQRQRSIFDMFDAFGSGGLTAQQRVNAKAPAVEITVKPLPVQGRPANFAGAVGSYQFTAEGSPREVKVGEPVTMRLRVSGKGNFDRVAAPTMTDATGWRSYPPSGTFSQDDEFAMSGTKNFELAVIPETAHTALPEFQFSFFDPTAEKYATLKSVPSPLVVRGAPPPPPPPVVPAGKGGPAPSEAPPPPAPLADILGLHYEPGAAGQRFEPLYTQRSFRLAQLVPLGLVLAMLAGRFLRRSDGDRARLGQRRERDALLRKLRVEPSPAGFFDTAARVLQLESARGSARVAASIDAREACATRRLDPETAAAVAEIFSARAELLYAGHGGGEAGPITSADRERVLATIERFSTAHVQA